MRRMRGHLAHLMARFREMGEPVASEVEDDVFAARVLTPAEIALWREMDAHDRRHSVTVARRFVAVMPSALREEVAAALLHDVGKSVVRLGRIGRAVATILPLTPAMRSYRDHERIGAELLRAGGVSERVVELVARDVDDEVARALRCADDAVD